MLHELRVLKQAHTEESYDYIWYGSAVLQINSTATVIQSLLVFQRLGTVYRTRGYGELSYPYSALHGCVFSDLYRASVCPSLGPVDLNRWVCLSIPFHPVQVLIQSGESQSIAEGFRHGVPEDDLGTTISDQ